MARTKIATLNLRIAPGVKEAVREAAGMETEIGSLQKESGCALGPPAQPG